MAQPRLTATHWGNYLIAEEEDGGSSVQPVTQDPEPSPIGRSLARFTGSEFSRCETDDLPRLL
jgi:hypothetical protein